jgi:high-affinity iron transporter
MDRRRHLRGLYRRVSRSAFIREITEAFTGMGQELFNASILSIAVLMLTWHNVWMSSHGRELATEARALGQSVASGTRTLLALSIVCGVAVLREGSEVVLFLYGILASGGDSFSSVFGGGLIGLLLGAGVSVLTYLGLLRIPGRYLFAATSGMIALLAAGLASQAVAFLQQAGMLNAFSDTLWDTSWLLSDSSILGRVLHTLIGYNDHPSGMQLIAYFAVLALTFLLTKAVAPAPTLAGSSR